MEHYSIKFKDNDFTPEGRGMINYTYKKFRSDINNSEISDSDKNAALDGINNFLREYKFQSIARDLNN